MCSVQRLREVVRERLAAAAEEICGEFEKVIFQYEEEIKYQRRLLEITRGYRMDLLQQPAGKKEVQTDQQLWNQERNSVLEPPQMKEEQEELCISQEGEVLAVKLEADSLTVTPISEENDQSEAEPISEQQDEDGSQHLDSGSTEEEEPRTKKRHLTHRSHSNSDDDCLTSEIHDEDKMDTPWGNDNEEVLTFQQLWNKERKCILDQEDRDAAQVEMEEHKLYIRQEEEETDAFMVTPIFEERNNKTESNSKQPLFQNSSDTESQEQRAGNNVNPGSSKYEETRETQMMKYCRNHTMNEPNVCDLCGKTFRRRVNLLIHKRLHTGERPYSCEVCGRNFTQGCNLKRHMETHTDEKHSCETCGKSFNSSYYLRIHMRLHTNERPYSCGICGQSFSRSGPLKIHMRIHTGEKPYSCEICGKCFTQCGTWKSHMRIHSGERPYCCETCGKRFTESSRLTRHLTIHRRGAPVQ
ncbi:uncharacterized protein KZ484_025470 [Pholidichthys leucotaenia]